METTGKQLLSVTTLIAAIGVRVLFIFHNVFAVWRVVVTREDMRYWALIVTNLGMVAEGVIVVKRNGGMEWKWWCPCFLCYLVTTLPSLWLLQLGQLESLDLTPTAGSNKTALDMTLTAGSNQTTLDLTPTAGSNQTTLTTLNATLHPSTTQSAFHETVDIILEIADTTWIVILQEVFVYFIVFGRWMLPRADLSRMALSELLFEYLGKACDIMELYALFDEDVIRTDLHYTYVILVIWSVSFLQFVPVLTHKQRYRRLESKHLLCIQRSFGDHFAEVVITCLTLFLQDGPFLYLRLYIIVTLKLIRYSLVFFILKNILTILLLLYRIAVLTSRMSCCQCRKSNVVDIENVS